MNALAHPDVSVLFSEPKIPQSLSRNWLAIADWVSVLFSEPKIPQSSDQRHAGACLARFSALQRAENSSMLKTRDTTTCSQPCFSALQRAENSSIPSGVQDAFRQMPFQCSSASRKFLNLVQRRRRQHVKQFQCSSASRKFLNLDPRTCVHPYFRPR